MTRASRLRRFLAAPALAACAALALLAAPLAAQDPRPPTPRVVPTRPDTIPRPRPDTIPRPRAPQDSVQVAIPPEAVRGDTLPTSPDSAAADTAQQDTTVPAPLLPRHPLPPARGFADGSWVWDRAQLSYFQGLSLAELLDRIPGVVTTQTGGFGRPMAASPYAAGGGRFRVFLDGYELRAMNGSVPDLQQIPLVNLESVRVQRSLSELRIDLESFRLSDARPFAQIEGADGDYDTRYLRGFFTRPIGTHWLPEVGLDLDETRGFRRVEAFGATHLVARLGYSFSPDLGLQIEYRSTSADVGRAGTAGSIFESFDRNELILRGRARLLGRLSLEGQIGRSRVEPTGEDTVTLGAESVQALARATYDTRLGQFSGGVRLFTGGDEGGWAPNGSELFARADLAPSASLSAWGEVRALTLGGFGGVETEGGARLGPFGGFALFGSVAAGTRGVRYASDSLAVVETIAGGVIGIPGVQVLDTVPVRAFLTAETELTGLRAGVDFTRGRVALGAAYVLQDVDQVAPYGLFFDRGFDPVATGEPAAGVEAYFSVPLLLPGVRADGWYLRFLESDRPWQPSQLGRAAFQFNRVYYGGNLEPTVRLEVVGRDEARARNPVTGDLDQVTPRYALWNAYVQVRIIDIRVFWRFENLANRRTASDVPGTTLAGGRALFGVRWFFRN